MVVVKFRKALVVALIACFAFGAVGCSDKSSLGSTNTQTETSSNNEESNKNSNSSQENTESVAENKDSVKEDITNEGDSQKTEKNIEMSLYSKDVNTDKEVVLGKVYIKENLSLKEKLEILSKELSKKAFDNLPIEFVKISDINGKKIALFNLNELGNNASNISFDKYEGISWVNNYFAGSAGGSITEYTLITTLLQKNYTGEWIDGVEFTYKNSKVEFDHVPALSEISYR